MKAFKEAYEKLSDTQKEAVDAIEGPVMVIAGPGTGKTQILTLRIANILRKTDTAPEDILALTFTESGTRAMRERLVSYIGAEAYRVPIHTFHGFAENLIRQYPDAYARVVGGRPINDIERFECIGTILGDNGVKALRPIGNPEFYIPSIIRAINEMKKEYITPDTFGEMIGAQEKTLAGIEKMHEKGAHKGKVRGEYQQYEKLLIRNKELLMVYRQYEAFLSEDHLYDFEDMIVETIHALEANEDMLRDLQETCQYVLADEHQDVNGSQNRILELLASYHDSPNLFVVGDEKQAIYRFQGASLENFLYFEDHFKDTKTIALTENYRSAQQILDAAHSLIKEDEGPLAELRIALTAKGEVKKPAVERREYVHQGIEDAGVCKGIKKLIEKGTSPEEIAVIVRTNREVEEMAVLLRGEGISVDASADGDILSHPITHAVRALVSAVTVPHDEVGLSHVLHGAYWNITPEDLVRIMSARRYDRPLIEIIGSDELLKELGVKDVVSVRKVSEVLEGARKCALTLPPHRVLAYLIKESGLLMSSSTLDPFEGTRVIRRLYDEVEDMVLRDPEATLADIHERLALRIAHNLPLNAPYIKSGEQSVSVLTAHKSKGLEFKHVFIPHLTDARWGKKYTREYFNIPITKTIQKEDLDETDDERRLLYVAMTRAKEGLYLSSAETGSEGKEYVPSRLFSYIDEELLPFFDTKEEEKAFNSTGILSEDSSIAIDPLLLRTLLLERGLSATALNNYLKSPWDYFYRNVLRLPELQPLHMLYGTAMHDVLERMTGAHSREGALPSESEVKKLLDRSLGRLPISKEEFVALHEKGFEALVIYREHLAAMLPKETKEEFTVRATWKTGEKDIPEILLTGKLDRLDLDAEGRVVRVTDYKTGKPKTPGYIEGTTKDSDGGYKRQLVFYALLLSLLEDERYACKEGAISFVEPDKNGQIKEFLYIITDEEIESLKRKIIRVAREITHGAFLNAPCDPNKSEYCTYVHSLMNR